MNINLTVEPQENITITVSEAMSQSGGVTDHTKLSNIGTNTHAQIDTALTTVEQEIAAIESILAAPETLPYYRNESIVRGTTALNTEDMYSYVDINEPRFTTGVRNAKGILLEPALTNNMLYTEGAQDFSLWVDYSGFTKTITSGQLGPYGRNDAYRIVSNEIGTATRKFSAGTSFGMNSASVSIWVKNNDPNNLVTFSVIGGTTKSETIAYSEGWKFIEILAVPHNGGLGSYCAFFTASALLPIDVTCFRPTAESTGVVTSFYNASQRYADNLKFPRDCIVGLTEGTIEGIIKVKHQALSVTVFTLGTGVGAGGGSAGIAVTQNGVSTLISASVASIQAVITLPYLVTKNTNIYIACRWKAGEKTKVYAFVDGVEYTAESASTFTTIIPFNSFTSSQGSITGNCIIDSIRISSNQKTIGELQTEAASTLPFARETTTTYLMDFNNGLVNNTVGVIDSKTIFSSDKYDHDLVLFSKFQEMLRVISDSTKILRVLMFNPTVDDTVTQLQIAATMKVDKLGVNALNTAPTVYNSTGTLGEIRITSDYIFVCTATNTWKRVAISTW